MQNYSCTDGAPVHVVAGMAGYQLAKDSDLKPTPDKYFELVDNKHWGYTRLNFVNSSILEFEYVTDMTSEVFDSFIVHNSVYM